MLGSTIPWMRRLVLEGARHPIVRRQAETIARSSPGVHPAVACFRWVRRRPYVTDDIRTRALGLRGDVAELLQGAPYQIATGAPGDCDCRSVLLQSLLRSLGYRTAFVVVREPGAPQYSHVYSAILLRGGGVIPMDTIMNGDGGRPLFDAGTEIPKGVALDRRVIPVSEQPGIGLGALAVLGLLAWRALR